MLKYRDITIWLLVGLVLRCAYVIFLNQPANFNFSDMANYLRMADDIQNNQWSENLFFQPIGYSVVLLIIKKLFANWSLALGLVQVLFSTLSLLLMWKAVEEIWHTKVARYSLIIGVFHLPFITYNGFALSETLFGFQLALLLYLSCRIIKTSAQKTYLAILWAIAFLIGFWLKGSLVFMVPLFLLGIAYFYRMSGILKTVLPIALIVSAGLIGHGLFTKNKIGKFQMSASAGGLNLVEGKCPSKKNYDSRGILWISPLYFQLQHTPERTWNEPFTNSSYFMKEGIKCIIDNPFVMIQSFESIPYLFFGNTLWPANQLQGASWVRLYELLLALFMVPGIMLFFILKRNQIYVDELLIWVVPVLSIFLCVYVFKSEIRFRVPFDFFMIPLAVKGWSLLRNISNGFEPIGTALD